MARAVHALQVHKLQLERQNEELRLTRQSLEAALERYTEVFDYAPIGYVALDVVGRIRDVNQAAARMLGVDRARLIDQPFAQHISPVHAQVFDRLRTAAVASGGPVGCELDLQRHESPIPARLTAAAIQRRGLSVLVACEDISDRRADELELTRTAAALRDANRRKDEFIAMMSHELRNPLSPIRTSVGVLRLAPPGSEHAREAIDIIDRSATHLSRLVDELLDISRVSHGKIELRRVPLELTTLVRRVLDDHRGGIAMARLHLEASLGSHPLWVDGDEARLVQVFSNLMNNAEKFTPAGGRITVHIEHDRDSAIVSVRDTGVGISSELAHELFEPFAQAPQALARSGGGLGLGLALVRRLVDLHGGSVEIHSPGLGKGTTVTVRLPAAPRHELVAERRAVPLAPRRRVLIVEDQRDAAESLRNALLFKGHEVDVAVTAHQALAMMTAARPDVVLCDLGLPDIDGYALAMRVRGSPQLRGIYMVALSGYARDEDVGRARRAGFQRHLAKPARLEDIDEILASLPAPAGGVTGDAR